MKKLFGVALLAAVLVIIGYLVNRTPLVTINKADDFEQCAGVFEDNIVAMLNADDITITVAGTEVTEFGYEFFVSPEMKLMVEGEFLRSLLSCSVLEYPDGKVLVMKGENRIDLTLDSDSACINERETISLLSKVYRDKETGKLFLPIDDIAGYLSYEVNYDLAAGWIDLKREPGEVLLPTAYDMRDYGRVTAVRDQGRYGTCWAFASLGALETTLLPRESNVFSTDHMTLCNSYNLDLSKGGEHTMSIAYLAAWQGPVYEKDDPYGDGQTDSSLTAVKHLEEALVINDRDFDILKSAIFRYGAIETSLYSQMEYADSVSKYYSESNAAYYYDGDAVPNHDVVVVGWDDEYPKENFTKQPEDDGAFICKNSWSEEFGEDGYFYVSYYDSNICNKSVVYTRVGEADNYDKIYQSDLLGWIGLMGFGKEEAYFSNVYQAGKGEELAAVSFYATDRNTEFEVYVVRDFVNTASMKNREFIVSGSMKYAGYYTVDFPEPILLGDNEKYAVIVKIKTPGAVHPIAIEYNVDERTENFDIADGEGYISLYGELWHSAEATQNCNVCLKAFTRYDNKTDGEDLNTSGTTESSIEVENATGQDAPETDIRTEENE
ncbi:MAG: lectin like domain-containing protein [Lachnospiraceae bacterium]|nr:lectin like domain-containing protein [Lachnospiraceae bacterium]